MKYFLILLLGCLPFFAAAQDSTVQIKPETARYYLEIEDEVFLLREKDSISNELIYNLSSEIRLKDMIITSLQGDTLIYQKREEALIQNAKWLERDLELTEKKLKKSQFRGTVLIGATGGAMLGSAIPGVGTVLGAAGGSVVGIVIHLVRRN
jgi:hypothetical protein